MNEFMGRLIKLKKEILLTYGNPDVNSYLLQYLEELVDIMIGLGMDGIEEDSDYNG